jgi:hypothetical protein
VPIGQVAALTFMAVGFIAVGRSRPDRLWLVAGIAVLASTGFVLVRDGLDLIVISDSGSAATTIAALLLGSLAWSRALVRPQRSLASPEGRRRGRAVSLATVAVSCLLIGLANARGLDPATTGLTEPRAWVVLGALVLGGATLVGSLVLALRR